MCMYDQISTSNVSRPYGHNIFDHEFGLFSLSQKNNKKQANQITVLNKYFVLIG